VDKATRAWSGRRWREDSPFRTKHLPMSFDAFVRLLVPSCAMSPEYGSHPITYRAVGKVSRLLPHAAGWRGWAVSDFRTHHCGQRLATLLRLSLQKIAHRHHVDTAKAPEPEQMLVAGDDDI